MAQARKKRQGTGWTYRENNSHHPRRDVPPKQFYTESVPSEPEGPAWNEPEYMDPDSPHEKLPVGTRYWQGFVKASYYPFIEEERAMSPGWVAKVTADVPSRPLERLAEDSRDPDPHWERRVRVTERARINREYFRFWPG